MTGNMHSKDGMEYGGGYEDIVGMVGMSMICKGYGDTVGVMCGFILAGQRSRANGLHGHRLSITSSGFTHRNSWIGGCSTSLY